MAEPLLKSDRGSLFWRLWWRALFVKRAQAVLTVSSLFVAASIASLLLNLYGEVRRKMVEEFRTYGSNVVLAPALTRGAEQPPLSPFPSLATAGSGQALAREGKQEWPAAPPGAVMDKASLRPLQAFKQRIPGLAAAPVLYGIARLARIQADPRLPEFVNVVAVGTDFAALRHIFTGWRMNGQSLLAHGACVVGAHLAAKLRLQVGDDLNLEPIAGAVGAVAAATHTPLRPCLCRVAGVLSTGASEDDQVFVPLQDLQSRLGMNGKLSLVELAVPGDTAEVERTIEELTAALPGVEVRPIRQIVYSEGKVLGTIRWLLLSLTALILLIIAICVMATMAAIVLERRKDIGVMKALGAGDALVMRLFLAESAGLGLLGGLVGFSLGVVLANGVAQHLFGVTLGMNWWTLPVVCGLTMLLAVVATLFPVRIVRDIQPAVVLKGE